MSLWARDLNTELPCWMHVDGWWCLVTAWFDIDGRRYWLSTEKQREYPTLLKDLRPPQINPLSWDWLQRNNHQVMYTMLFGAAKTGAEE